MDYLKKIRDNFASDGFMCIDCKEPDICYMVMDEIWRSAVPNYFKLKVARLAEAKRLGAKSYCVTLCPSCLSKRLGRKLKRKDFTNNPGNKALFRAIESIDLENGN